MSLRLALFNLPKKLLPLLDQHSVRNFCVARKKIFNKMEYLATARENPVILKLDTKEFKAILTEEVLKLKELFDKYGYELRLAGGPVRDLLMGVQPKDLDFATVATPNEMKDMFTKENVRLVNMNGEKHGTITPRINDKENFEVTTLRIDIVTNGRHAEVRFTSDWRLDANRRDLTINSMFLDFEGRVYDYFYGYEDLQAKKVVFVGDAETRICEDYLRILRYFRFYGRIATSSNNHDEETLQCIKNNGHGLERISGERIWVELKKMLSGNFGGDLLKLMMELNLGKYLGLPDKVNYSELEKVWNNGNSNCHPITLLSSLLADIDDVANLNSRLKFSTFDRDLAYFIVEHRSDKLSCDPLLPYQKLLVNAKIKDDIARQYIAEVLKYRNDRVLLERFDQWIMPKFPRISVQSMNENGVTAPKLYATVINGLKNYWAENNFDLTMEQLEKHIPVIASNLDNVQYEKRPKIKKR